MSGNLYAWPSGIPKFSYPLSGRHICIPGEDPAEFESLLAGIEAEMQPTGEATRFLVEEMAQCQWKIRRSTVILRDHFCFLLNLADYNVVANAYQRDAAGVQSVTKIARYENLLRRAWRECYKLLLQNRTPPRTQKWDADGSEPRVQQAGSSNPPFRSTTPVRQKWTGIDNPAPCSEVRPSTSDLPAVFEATPLAPNSDLRPPISLQGEVEAS